MATEIDEMPAVRTTMTEAKSGMKQAEDENTSARTAVSVSTSLLLAALSGLIFSLGAAIVKQMTNIHPAQLVCYRYCIIASLCLPQAVWRNENLLGPPGYRILIYSRAIAACVGALLAFITYLYLPIGEATVIISSYPAFVTIVGKIFLNETFGLLQVLSIIFTIIGMILMAGVYENFVENIPVYTPDRIYGLIAGFACVLCMTLYFMLTRKSKHVHYSVLLYQSGVAAIVQGVVVVLVMDKFRLVYRGLQQCFIILIGFVGYFAMVTVTIATQNLDAGPVSTLRAGVDIFFSFVWQIIIYHDSPNSIKILGALLVCLSIAFVGFTKQIKKLLPTKCQKLC